MKLSKKIRNAIFVAMSFAMIGSLTLTGCSDGSDNDDSKNETAKDETTYVKKFDITKNTYAETPQVQVKIDTGIDTFMVGDKITVHMKGVASKKFAAELYIVDTSEAANYWSSLAIKSADDDGKEVLDINTEFNITKTFEITSINKGKVSDVKFAINGTDGDETIKIKCTEFSIARDGIIKVEKVELNKTSATPTVGDTVELTATVTPDNATDKTVTWKSDKEEIAKVDATGKVTAVAPGTATITVTTDDGKKTAECKITVPVTYNLENGVIFGTFNNWSGETAPKFTKNSDGTYSATIRITADITEFEAKIANSDWSIKIGGGVTISVGGSEQQAALAPTDDDPAIKITEVAKLDELKVTITDDLKIKIEKTGTVTPPADGGSTTPAAAWEGSTTFTSWKKGEGETDINIGPEKLTSKTTGLKIYWSASADEGITLKMQTMNGASSHDVKFKKPDDPEFKDVCYLWATTTNTVFTIDSADLEDFRQYGVQVYGDKITVTKVEIIEAE